MLNPDEVLTREGAEEFRARLWLISDGLFHLINQEDDLEIKSEDLEALYKAQEIVDRMRKDVRRNS